MPFDFETKASARLKAQTCLRIGIVGFGTFGQFLAKRLIQQGHKVSVASASPNSNHNILELHVRMTTAACCHVAGGVRWCCSSYVCKALPCNICMLSTRQAMRCYGM